jgi:hypothetical protein
MSQQDVPEQDVPEQDVPEQDMAHQNMRGQDVPGDGGPLEREAGQPRALEPAEPASGVVVRRADDDRLVVWRRRALAARAALPQLARHPVVVGASAAAATVAVRIAVDVATRALTGQAAQAAGRSQVPATLAVTGRVVHDVHVVHHLHVIHHTTDLALFGWPPRPGR